ncbi:ABC transporter permease [Nonomuraea lactucae]|uniref:ABC transporter permease n=1 Tax=Nonomuraea lactucae TaxID=2249762 RepID=UPI000DE1AE11|nr:ABC transporter permease [Nonomuraea lactucae]
MTDQLLEHRRSAEGADPAGQSTVSTASIAGRLGGLRLPRFGGLILLAALIAGFGAAMPETFLTMQTATSVARGQSITIVLALSLTVCLSAGVFDLSIGSNVGFGAVLALSLMATHGWSPLLASVATVFVCAAVGAVNAVLVVGVGMDSFIATLGVSSILTAITLMASGGVIVGPAPSGFQSIAAWQPWGIPVLVIYALALCLVAWYVLEHTPLGRRLYATGANKAAATLAGISTDRYVVGALVTCGLGAGLSAVLLSASVGSISPAAGAGYLLPVFAGCFLATTQVKPGRYNVAGLLIALFLLGTGVKGFSLLGGEVWIPDMFNGLALLVAVGLTVYLQKREIRRSKVRLSPSRAPE